MSSVLCIMSPSCAFSQNEVVDECLDTHVFIASQAMDVLLRYKEAPIVSILDEKPSDYSERETNALVNLVKEKLTENVVGFYDLKNLCPCFDSLIEKSQNYWFEITKEYFSRGIKEEKTGAKKKKGQKDSDNIIALKQRHELNKKKQQNVSEALDIVRFEIILSEYQSFFCL
ncbi:MAG: hypothetical protein KDD52_08680 [Bdellovibrionales bacterium]|nr:hypothetical protein [Bdellovibrionales bacterium]